MVCVNCREKVTDGMFCILCGWNQNQMPQSNTLSEIHEKWKKRKHYRELGAKGKEGYDLAWRRLSAFSEKKIQQIACEDYQEILDEMVEEGLSISTQQKVQQLISQLSKLAIREKIITENYAQDLFLGGKSRKTSLPFEDRHIKSLIEYAASSENRYHHAAMVTLCLIFTGYRPDEFFNIRCENLNPRTSLLISGSKTEAGKDRIVPILSIIQPYIFKWYLSCPVENHQRCGYLVRGPKGAKKNLGNWREREFYPMTQELGINTILQLNQKKVMKHVTPYSARHTFATLAYKAGVDKDMLIKMIGHAKFETTMKFYIHSEMELICSEAQKIENYLAGNGHKKTPL